MAKKPYKWITAERLQVLNEEFELYSTKRSFTKACQAVAIRLGITSSAVNYAYNNLIKHFGYIPITTPEYSLIRKKKPVKEKLPRKQKARKTNCIRCLVLLTKENRGTTTRTLCRTCYNTYMRDYFKTRKDKHNEIMKNWRARHKDKVREMHVKYITKKHGSMYEYGKKYHEDNSVNLKDPYLKMLLTKDLGRDIRRDIPQELIDLQRKKTLLIRKIKQSNAQSNQNI
jgi:hypothetical protein